MACSITTTLAALCNSDIGKLDNKIKLLQIIAQLTCEAASGGDIMACNLTSTLASLCDSEIGKLDNKITLLKIIAFLACEAAEAASGGACAALSGDSPPTDSVTPDFVGQLYNQNNGEAFFYSTGLTSADWVEIAGAADFIEAQNTGTDWGLLGSFGTIVLTDNQNLQSIGFPTMTSVDGTFYINSCSLLASLLLPSLSRCGDELNFNGNLALTSIDLPALITIVGSCNIFNCPSLTSFNAPLWLPTDGTSINFSGCALPAASVNQILARCVAGAVTTCTIDLSGGTSSPPTGQGVLDSAALTTAGNTVTTN